MSKNKALDAYDLFGPNVAAEYIPLAYIYDRKQIKAKVAGAENVADVLFYLSWNVDLNKAYEKRRFFRQRFGCLVIVDEIAAFAELSALNNDEINSIIDGSDLDTTAKIKRLRELKSQWWTKSKEADATLLSLDDWLGDVWTKDEADWTILQTAKDGNVDYLTSLLDCFDPRIEGTWANNKYFLNLGPKTFPCVITKEKIKFLWRKIKTQKL